GRFLGRLSVFRPLSLTGHIPGGLGRNLDLPSARRASRSPPGVHVPRLESLAAFTRENDRHGSTSRESSRGSPRAEHRPEHDLILEPRRAVARPCIGAILKPASGLLSPSRFNPRIEPASDASGSVPGPRLTRCRSVMGATTRQNRAWRPMWRTQRIL